MEKARRFFLSLSFLTLASTAFASVVEPSESRITLQTISDNTPTQPAPVSPFSFEFTAEDYSPQSGLEYGLIPVSNPDGTPSFQFRPIVLYRHDVINTYAETLYWIGATYYYAVNHEGTTNVVTDSSGNIVWDGEYEAFGSVIRSNGTLNFTPSYTGKQYDADTGLYYYNARFYEPELGRFLNSDPARDGINWYEYALDNPLRFTDPTGLENVMDAYKAQKAAEAHQVTVKIQKQMQARNDAMLPHNDANGTAFGTLFPKTFGSATEGRGKFGAQVAEALVVGAIPVEVPLLGEAAGAGIQAIKGALTTSAAKAGAKVGEEAAQVGATQATENALKPGEFNITDWKGYPEGVPKPEGPFKLLEGDEYKAARAAADKANKAMHAADPTLDGLQIHEVKPVKFNGSPTDPANKVPLTPEQHSPLTTWWNQLMRTMQK